MFDFVVTKSFIQMLTFASKNGKSCEMIPQKDEAFLVVWLPFSVPNRVRVPRQPQTEKNIKVEQIYATNLAKLQQTCEWNPERMKPFLLFGFPFWSQIVSVSQRQPKPKMTSKLNRYMPQSEQNGTKYVNGNQ